jgi:hypothetical protein
MRAPTQSFAEAIDQFRHRYPAFECQFLVRMRRCTGIPQPRTPTDYEEFAGSLYVAWTVARQWPQRPEVRQEFQREMIRRRDAIRPLLAESWLAPIRPYLEQQIRICTAAANYRGDILLFESIEGEGLPKRHDHLTVAELGRKRRGTGKMLFVREVSAAMRDIFGKPYDKVVGELAGLAFETKPLSAETVRTMCKKTGSIRQK